MNRRLTRGVAAGVAALAVSASASALSTGTGAADVSSNIVRGGVLRLGLGAGEPARATLGFDRLAPGQVRTVRVWLATNEPISTVPAVLALTVDAVRDVPAPCAISLGKAQAEIDSGIDGCTIAAGIAAGTPRQGNLSRVLAFDIRYAPSIDGRCSSDPGVPLVDATDVGNLRAMVGRTTMLTRPDRSTPLRLAPGHAVCVSVTVRWPRVGAVVGSPEHPLDNAVQGDSLTVGVRFDLTQVGW
jgi:hypothetical protein